eukprot:CAMPEP_0115108272 /NCGR_PEP_ID=MMETSP0227-20121206/37887_1 /TAXON_ID=89957 /ORGANISM="Polarella glacialis, Strain CCMP 1383" /LENGTH=422 /DNA_ID=CAMNT_0002506499 /DNA_START=36 /DNA_END=1305 /DNA_ORIENTATION=+
MIADESISELISITGASADEARGYLEMAGGDLQQAANLFLEMGGGGGGGPAASPFYGPLLRRADVRAPIAAFQDQMVNPEHEQRRMEAAMLADSAAMQRRMTFDRGANQPGAGAGDDEDEDSDTPMAAAPGQAINQLFAPPPYNETQSYYQTIEKAKAEGKFVLVNIQQAEVFASHALNRDVWRDDTIQDIIEGSFLFWQRDDKSTEGDQFCQYHSCGHQLPHICIIDPRTGRRVKNWDGRKWTESHAAAEYLFGFLDQYSMSRSPPAMSPAGSPIMEPKDFPMMDEQMQLTGLDDFVAASGGSAAGSAQEASAAAAAVPAEPVQKEPVPTLPEEPVESLEHLKVSLRLPSGSRITRRFLPTDSLEQMFIVAAALSEQPLRLVDLSTQFPKRSLRDVEGGLQILMKDAQVAGSVVMVTVRSE